MPFIDVPGYGRFEPALPAWLELRPDGLLYNKNATDQTKPWRPPVGYVGGTDVKFTPEGQVPTTPPPAPPVEPPAQPPQTASSAVKAYLDYQRQVLALAEASVEQERKNLDSQAALVKVARAAFDTLTAAIGQE